MSSDGFWLRDFSVGFPPIFYMETDGIPDIFPGFLHSE
jgi:hypothetical protein